MQNFFNAITPVGHEICIDKYGHYVIEKFLQECHELQMLDTLIKFLDRIIIQHFDMLKDYCYPCRVIQNQFLQSKLYHLQEYTLKQLNTFSIRNSNQYNYPITNLHVMLKHSIGNYVIQVMIDICCQLNLHHMIQYMLNFIVRNANTLSCDQFGCRVIQWCLIKNIPIESKLALFLNIIQSLSTIANDEWGHFCVRQCLEHPLTQSLWYMFVECIFFGTDPNVPNFADSSTYGGRYTLSPKLQLQFESFMLNVRDKSLINNFSKFGFGKYSSVVCDCALKYSTSKQKSRLVNFLCNSNVEIKHNVLFGMVNHKYGNFVIKNLIESLIFMEKQSTYTTYNTSYIYNCNENRAQYYWWTSMLNKISTVLEGATHIILRIDFHFHIMQCV